MHAPAGSTFAIVRFWFGVSRKSPRWIFAISRRPVSRAPKSVSPMRPASMRSVRCPVAVVAFDPAEAVALLRELERSRRLEFEPLALRELGNEPVEAAIVDRVLESRALAHGAVAEIALAS
jgi:hypothetical protein